MDARFKSIDVVCLHARGTHDSRKVERNAGRVETASTVVNARLHEGFGVPDVGRNMSTPDRGTLHRVLVEGSIFRPCALGLAPWIVAVVVPGLRVTAVVIWTDVFCDRAGPDSIQPEP